MDKNVIARFSTPIRIAHWVNAICFIMLVCTGLPLYTDFFNFIYPIFGGAAGTQLVHRIFAVIFLLPTVFILVTDPKGFFQWTGNVLTWKSSDIQYFFEMPKELLGMKTNMPKQDFFNGGQKLNSIITIAGAVIMVCSGTIMWFKDSFSKDLVQIAYPLHDIGIAVMVSVIFVHVYMGLFHPVARASLKGMTKGYVDVDYAKHHHGKWYDQVVEEQKGK